MTSSRIIIAGSPQTWFSQIGPFLQLAGHQVAEVGNPVQAIREAAAGLHDVLIVTPCLADMCTYDLCRTVRPKSNLGIILLIDDDDRQTKINALEAAADDYMIAPFLPEELLARVRALLRRVAHAGSLKLLSGDFSGPAAIAPISVRVRWESALPVRAAELKAHEVEPPTLEGDGYQIAVYGIPGAYLKGDPKSLGEPLKKAATLKREGKPDVKPSRVEVFQTSGVVAYLFPYSAELSERDVLVRFSALIGRMAVEHSFDLRQMRFDGKLEL